MLVLTLPKVESRASVAVFGYKIAGKLLRCHIVSPCVFLGAVIPEIGSPSVGIRALVKPCVTRDVAHRVALDTDIYIRPRFDVECKVRHQSAQVYSSVTQCDLPAP